MGAKNIAAESFDNLLERFDFAGDGQTVEVVSVSLTLALTNADDPLGVIGYLGSIGIVVNELDDIMRINGVADEEELSAYRVAEGVAVTVASQGEWVLFRP